ncbi:MAG: PAS domain S-box protein [Alkalispirochaeta sp.]
MNHRRYAILLVEDQALIAMAQKRQLEDFGYTVHHVLNGEDAVQSVCESGSHFDLILMDIDLGSGIDGTEAAEQILTRIDIPVVFLSSHTNPEIVEKTEKITSYGYVLKNSGIAVLDTSIKLARRLHTAKRRVAKSEEEYRRLFETMSPGVVYHSSEGTIVSANPSAERILGITVDQMNGKTAMDPRWQMIDPEGAPVSGSDHPANIALRTGQRFGPVDRGVFVPERNAYVWLSITAIPLFMPGADRPYQVYAMFDEITERKRAEAALRDAEWKFRALFERGPIGVAYQQMIYDPAGNAVDYRFLDANPGYMQLTGVDPRGKTATEVFPGIEHDPFDWIGTFGRVARTGEQIRFETRLEANNSWYDCVAYQYKLDHFVAAFINISDRKEAEEQLLENHKKMLSIYSVAPTGIGVVSNRVLKEVNPLVCEMTGYSRDELLGNDARMLYPSQEEYDFVGKEKYDQIEKTGAGSVETRWRTKNGAVIDVLLASTPIDARDTTADVIFTALDITDRKHAQEEIRRQLTEKEILLKEVHHRIKNNMAQIEGLLSIQADSTDNDEVAAGLQGAISRVGSIRVLYEKLLIGTGYHEVSMKDYAESLVDALVAVFGKQKNVTVEKDIADFALSSKSAIPVGIILNELLTNALKYAFLGRERGHVLVHLEKTNLRVTLTVRDDGIGSDQRFVANKTPGFGLTIVKMLTEQLQGTFNVANDGGRKTVLTFEVVR